VSVEFAIGGRREGRRDVMKRFMLSAALVLVTAPLFSTGVVEYEGPVATAEHLGGLATFVTMAAAVGLDDVLAGDTVTVFAPTDAAFDALPTDLVDHLMDDPATLLLVLRNHVVSGSLREGSLTALDVVVSTAGERIAVSVSDDRLSYGAATIVDTNHDTSTGVLHTIDAVVFPESIDRNRLAQPDIVEFLATDDRFTGLAQLILESGLSEQLHGGSYTLLAPTDRAFASWDGVVGDISLRRLVSYHLVTGEHGAQSIAGANRLETLYGRPIAVMTDSGNILVNDAVVEITDITVRNGVIHVIDRVLDPPTSTIEETLLEDDRFTILARAIESTGLAVVLDANPSITLFAPTDQALEDQVDLTSVEDDPRRVHDLVLNHMIYGEVFAAELATLHSIRTLRSLALPVSMRDGRIILDNSAEIVDANILASNGVIHAIDHVLHRSDQR
jgi:transforming growth factor-beta-induced protein